MTQHTKARTAQTSTGRRRADRRPFFTKHAGTKKGRTRTKDTAPAATTKQKPAKRPSDRVRTTPGGPLVYTEARRAVLAARAAQGGLKGLFAGEMLKRDDNLRRLARATEEISAESPWEFTRTARLTDRGFAGAGGGRQACIGRMPEVRGTTAQVAGLYPFCTGAIVPVQGTPVGNHLETGQRVQFDPMTWFIAGVITAPVAFVLALNGYGKSSFVRRIVIGAQAQGQIPLILGDIKPDYAALIAAIGGQVVRLGYGYGCLNPLAVGALGTIRDQLPDEESRHSLDVEVRARQVRMVAGLVELVRGSKVADYEETLIHAGLDMLYGPVTVDADGHRIGGFLAQQPPLLEDLLRVIAAGGDGMRTAAEAETPEEYMGLIGKLRRSLRALVGGPFGQVFNGHTTEPLDLSRPGVCIDVSKIPKGDAKLKAAVLMVCWADGFGAVEAAHRLADAVPDVPQSNFLVVMDELWQVLGSGAGMVDRVNELTRLNRSDGAALVMITHTINDLSAFDSPADVKKALGFIDRARVKVIGPVGAEELDQLRGRVEFTATERNEIVRWAASPPPGDDYRQRNAARPVPYGMGKFIIKIGESDSPGIPLQMVFTPTEWSSGVHATNSRFDDLTAARS